MVRLMGCLLPSMAPESRLLRLKGIPIVTRGHQLSIRKCERSVLGYFGIFLEGSAVYTTKRLCAPLGPSAALAAPLNVSMGWSGNSCGCEFGGCSQTATTAPAAAAATATTASAATATALERAGHFELIAFEQAGERKGPRSTSRLERLFEFKS